MSLPIILLRVLSLVTDSTTMNMSFGNFLQKSKLILHSTKFSTRIQKGLKLIQINRNECAKKKAFLYLERDFLMRTTFEIEDIHLLPEINESGINHKHSFD